MYGGFAIILAAMWGAIGHTIVDSRAARIEEEQRVLSRMAHVVRGQTQALFSLLDYFLVSADLHFQEHPKADPRTDPAFLKLIAEFRKATDNAIEIRFVGEDGGLYYIGSRPGNALANVSDRDYFQAQTQPDRHHGLFIAKPVLSRVTSLWGIPISHPLKSRPHGLAVIFAAIENRTLERAFEEGRTKPDGTILLAHQDGTILFRSPDLGMTGKSLANMPVWNEKVLPQREGVFRLDSAPLDNHARIGAYTSLPGYPLLVIATSTLDDTLTSWKERSFWLVALGVLATAIGMGLLAMMNRSMRELSVARRKLEQQAFIDELTQIPNRRHFLEQGKNELVRATRYRHALSLLMLDIDHFKAINDTWGHESGDAVLKAVAKGIQNELRTTDLFGRIGGEEFAIALPETDHPTAIMIAERLRENIAWTPISGINNPAISISASIGVSSLDSEDKTLDQILARADKALYRAKRTGRNRVCANPEPA